jgi:hypothetical protein
MANYQSFDVVAALTAVIVLSPGADQSFTIMKAQAINAGASNAKLEVYRVPAAGTPGTNNALVPLKVIAAVVSNATVFDNLNGQVVENGKTLQIISPTTNSQITFSISVAVNTNT